MILFNAVSLLGEEQDMAQSVLALIAHDARKSGLVELLRPYREVLASVPLVATGNTGARVAQELRLEVERMSSGPEGGDIQIGARIVDGAVGAVIFLRDPLTAHPHEPDIQALLKLCDTHDIPVATNRATARLLLNSLEQLRLFPAGGSRGGV